MISFRRPAERMGGDCKSECERELGAFRDLAKVTLNAHKPAGAKAEGMMNFIVARQAAHTCRAPLTRRQDSGDGGEKAAAIPRMRAALQTRACMRNPTAPARSKSAGRC